MSTCRIFVLLPFMCASRHLLYSLDFSGVRGSWTMSSLETQFKQMIEKENLTGRSPIYQDFSRYIQFYVKWLWKKWLIIDWWLWTTLHETQIIKKDYGTNFMHFSSAKLLDFIGLSGGTPKWQANDQKIWHDLFWHQTLNGGRWIPMLYQNKTWLA